MSDYIQTVSGRRFHFLNPQPDEICIEDIAYALAHTVRWGGHCNPPITVAQHCVMVAKLLLQARCSFKVQLQGLLHDAAEAYIPDIPTPIKPFLTNFQEIEGYIERAVFQKFGIEAPLDPMVKRMDEESRKWEYRDLMKPKGSHEALTVGSRPTLTTWSADTAEFRFLSWFDDLNYAIENEEVPLDRAAA